MVLPLHSAVLDWALNSLMLAHICSQGTVANILFITADTSTFNVTDTVREEINVHLQDAVDKIPASEISVGAGDRHVPIKPTDESTRQCLDRLTIGKRCPNGERLVNFASAYRLVMRSACFQNLTDT